MTPEEIVDLINIVAVPEEGHQSFHDGLGPDTSFWVHTVGMDQFDRPELELRNVPALWVGAACRELNTWAAYSVDTEIKAEQNLETGAAVPILVRTTVSSAEHWAEHPTGALTLSVLRVGFTCECCPEPNNTLH